MIALAVAFASLGELGIGWARADLGADIRLALQDKVLAKARVGVEIVKLGATVDQCKSIYQLNPSATLIPASNLKLVTTAAALDRFGADFKFKTLLVRIDSDLALVGDGDPTLGDAEMLRKVGWGVTTLFVKWAEELKRRGVTSVGDVIVDDSIFDQTFAHSNWPVDQLQKRYVAQVGGVNLNANCLDFIINPTAGGKIVSYVLDPPTRYVTVRNTCVSGNQNKIYLTRANESNDIILKGEAVGTSAAAPVSVSIHDPPLFACTVLRETLESNGIQVNGIVRRDRTVRTQMRAGPLKKFAVLAVHETPLATVLARANKDSMNLYAESLCKRLGATASDAPGSWQNGTSAMGDFLRKTGVAGVEFRLDDGCGLSKQNGISPAAIGKVLSYVYTSPNAQAFISSLAVAGFDGTLDDRFRGSDLRGRVFAKSGYVSGVSGLSGYVQTRTGSWYAFSILMNGIPDGTNSVAKQIQEKIVTALDKWAE